MRNVTTDNKNRRSIRLPEYDYSQPGAYHVTICVHQAGALCKAPVGQPPLLGRVVNGEMILNDLGRIAHQGWEWLPKIFPGTAVDVFCVMPNHTHAIIRIKPIDDGGCGGSLQTAPTLGVLQNAPTTNGIIKPKPLGRLVGAYKTHTTVEINKQLNTPGVKFWQHNYYERIIRNEREYIAVWEYIENNPVNWVEDENYFEGDVLV
jgi:REP element-mobilizing transposase RayT